MTFWWWVRSLLLAWLGVPFLAHAVAFTGLLSFGFGKDLLRLVDTSYSPLIENILIAILYVSNGGMMFALGWLLAHFTRPAENNALRQCLLLLPALLVLAGWIVTLHLSGYSFSDENYVNLALMELPWGGIVFIALISGWLWAMALIPVGAQVCFTLGCYWRNRHFPDARNSIRLRNIMALLMLGLILVACWQVKVRADKFPPYNKGAMLNENFDIRDYIPGLQGNKLTALRGEPPFKFSEPWPHWDGATAAYPLYASAFYALNTLPYDMSFDETRKCCLALSRTPEAYNNIIADKADIIFVAQPSAGQKKRAREAGVALTYTPFAREAFVFITHVDNPVNSLTQQQVRDIFSGRITNWDSVGGQNRDIEVWQRPADSGSQTTMLAKVMKDTPMLPPQETEVAGGMGGVIRQVAEYQNTKSAIGYTFRYYATKMNTNKDIKLLAIDGITPTVGNIRNGLYPYTVDVYMVTRQDPNAKTQQIVDWFLSPQGQALVKDVGYSPLYEAEE